LADHGRLTDLSGHASFPWVPAEEPLEQRLSEAAWDAQDGTDPEREAVLADSVGRALLVVLDRLAPAERIALVLHDMFAVPFEEIAPILARSQVATKKLASRARQRVRGSAAVPSADLARHRQVVEAFLAAIRAGDLEGLLEVLDPDVVRRADAAALRPGMPTRTQGARNVAEESVLLASRSRFAEPALVDGAVGILVAPRGRLLVVLTLTVEDGRIAAYDVIAEPARLRELSLAVLDD
jgi:hypothetical protein